MVKHIFHEIKKIAIYFCVNGIRIVEDKFIIHYSLKIISVSVYCNIIKNRIFSHVRIIVHKMTVLIFHDMELFLDLSENINLKEKKSKSCQCILMIDLIQIIFCVIWDKNLSCKLVIKEIIGWYTNILYGPMHGYYYDWFTRILRVVLGIARNFSRRVEIAKIICVFVKK